MLSRVAESIYWMSRYMERVENTSRLLDVVRHLVLDLPDGVNNQWESLVLASGDNEEFEERYGEPNEANVSRFMVLDRENPNSIRSSLWAARENARTIREIISTDMWEQLNRAYLMVKNGTSEARLRDDAAGFYGDLGNACHLYLGAMDTTMTHNAGWHIARLGRLLERADKTSRVIDVKYFMLLPTVDYVGSPYDSMLWMALLRSMGAFEMYRREYHEITPRDVVEFLILHHEFPRSIHFCLIKAEQSLHAVTGTEPSRFRSRPEMLLGRLRSEMDFTEIDEILNRGLHEYLDHFQTRLNDVGQEIHKRFFAPVEREPATATG